MGGDEIVFKCAYVLIDEMSGISPANGSQPMDSEQLMVC